MLVATASKAATVASANDYPTSLETSASADHTVVFTTPGGVAEGETVVISFASEFDTSSIAEDDVDVEDDGADLTTAATCAGFEQASVAVSDDDLTITVCAGDSGAIAALSEVTVRIGLNATASGTGANQIVNPSGAGTYYVGIAGTFGDSGSIALPMLEEGSVSVEAEVSGGGGGGGGGGGAGGSACGDSTAPSISSVLVSGVTDESATISWNTSENASSAVDYGESASYEAGTESSTSLVTAHSVSLDSLADGTTYHFRVRSSDLCGNQATSSDFTFDTLDATAPKIAGVDVSLSCDTSATVRWTTDETADSIVDYGPTAAYGSDESDAAFETEHAVLLSGLARDVTYHYRITSKDESGNVAQTSDATFSTDADAPPTNVAGFAVAAGDGRNGLSWNNASADHAGVRVLACTDTFPSDESDDGCEEVYDGGAESFSHTGLVNGTTYFYGAFAYDACGQFASGALGSGTPSAPEEEVLPTEEEEELPAAIPSEDIPSVAGESAMTEPGVAGESSEEIPAGEDSSEAEGPPAEKVSRAEGSDSTGKDQGTDAVGDADETVTAGDVTFFVANGRIRLAPARSGAVAMLSSRPLRAELQTEHVVKRVDRVRLLLGESEYLMSLSNDGSAYAADVSSPGSPGTYAIAVSIHYADGTVGSVGLIADVEPDGYAFAVENDQTLRAGGAVVTLFSNGTEAWDGSPYAQFNPYETADDGQFGWYVPNTTYALSAAADGYIPATSRTFSVTDNIANPTIRLDRVPADDVAAITPPSSFLEEILPTEIVEFVAAASGAVADALEVVRETPGVEEAATASVPALAVVTTAATVTLATSFNLLPFLQYLFTSPILMFGRRRRRAYGVVYNAITKMPLDLATVRLYRMPDDWQGERSVTGRLVQSRVTDKGGRYYFLPDPGRYRMVASKGGFVFASQYLSDTRDDGAYLDVYHGEPLEVTDRNAVISANIPLDPSQGAEHHEPKSIVRRRRLRVTQRAFAAGGIVLSAVVAVIQPGMVTLGMVGVQIAFYLLVRRLAAPRKPKAWGIVYDKRTGRPLAHAIARVFEPKYNKLLETAVTDSKGRYTFLLGPNEYYTVYEKQGFEPFEVRPIDYRAHAEPKEFSADVPLTPKQGDASSQGSSETTAP
jgi:hypothetical protein